MGDAASTIRELIDHAAADRASKAAFIDAANGQQISYLELRESCLALKRRFEEDGLKFGDVAAFLSENSILLAEHLLASMYAGLVPAPLSLLEAPERLSAVLKHCNAKVVYASNPQHGLAAAAGSMRGSRPG
jgi:acyl-CoA synthetase (AMP-forming)/AMP-acid ligase II